MALLRSHHKIVRDLAHVIAAPPLLSVGSGDGDAAAVWRLMAANSGRFVAELDRDPAPLEAFLVQVSGLGRVHNYHAALVQYWLCNVDWPGSGLGAAPRETVWSVPLRSSRHQATADIKVVTAIRDGGGAGGDGGAASGGAGGGAGGGTGTGGDSAATPTAAQQQQQNAGGVGAHHVIHVEPSLFFAIDTSGSIPGEGSGTESGTGDGEEPTVYALLGRGRVSRGGGNDGKEASSYSSPPSPLPPATATSTISKEGTVAGANDNLGALVSFDLDSNLAYRLELGLRKLAIPEASAPVRKWLLGRFDARRVSSLFRVAGAAFRPFRPIRPVEPVHPTPPSAVADAVTPAAVATKVAAAATAAANAAEADTHQSRRNAPANIGDDDAGDTSGNNDSNFGTIDDAGMPPTWWCDDVSIVNNTDSDSRFPVGVVNDESLLTLPFFSLSLLSPLSLLRAGRRIDQTAPLLPVGRSGLETPTVTRHFGAGEIYIYQRWYRIQCVPV